MNFPNSLSCSSSPFHSSICFSGHTLAPQCLCSSEVPRTGHSISGVTSLVPRTRGQSLPWSCCHTIADSGLLALLATWAHVQLLLTSSVRPFFPWKFSSHSAPAFSAAWGCRQVVVLTQVQNPALGFVGPHTIGLNSLMQHVQIPLLHLLFLQPINIPIHVGVLCKETEGSLNSFLEIVDNLIKQDQPQILSLEGDHY